MSIYVKRTAIPEMVMPATCCHCPLVGYDPDIKWLDDGKESIGAYRCLITGELIDNTKREDHCPLEETEDTNGS